MESRVGRLKLQMKGKLTADGEEIPDENEAFNSNAASMTTPLLMKYVNESGDPPVMEEFK